MSFAVLLVALAGVALSALLDTWLPGWVASLSGLALVLGLIALRRRSPSGDGRRAEDRESEDAGGGA